MASDKEFINVFEASALLGVHDQTLRKLARQKRIPAFKVGKEWRFRREALMRWADEQSQVETAGKNCSVLVIDDDEDVCQAHKRMLAQFGCHARTASGGLAGLELVAQHTPDLILLDLKMPDMNGPQFLAKLRQVHRDLPVVVATGYPDSELMKDAARYAPVLLLAKPIEAKLLERTVRTVMGETIARRSSG